MLVKAVKTEFYIRVISSVGRDERSFNEYATSCTHRAAAWFLLSEMGTQNANEV